jgi:hypothetical protein
VPVHGWPVSAAPSGIDVRARPPACSSRGYKTVRFDEFDQRILQYWLPSDFEPATVSGEVAGVAAGWNAQASSGSGSTTPPSS